jgi:cytochrome bd ubiquinol oxidase subunit II
MIADTLAAVVIAVTTAYAALAGADFGGGIWDLLAGSAARGEVPRRRIDRSITPVWEANHVWLIIAVVLLWTGFPTAFAAIFTTLFVPLSVAALGIVLRGTGFAFRAQVRTLRWQAVTGGVFAIASLLTPFFMGTVVGSVVSGRVRGTNGDPVSSWTNLTSLLTGGLFVATGAYLAAVYLATDSDRDSEPELRRYFTRRALVSGLVTGALAGVTMVQLRTSSPTVFTELTTGRGLPFVVVSVLAGLAVLVALTLGIVRPVRPLAVLAVAAVVWGWAISQYPYLLPPRLTIAAGAVPRAVEATELVVVGIIVVLVIPSFALLFRLAQSGRLAEAEEHHHPPPGGGPPGSGPAVARAVRAQPPPRDRPRFSRRLRRSWPIAVAAVAIAAWGLRRRGTRAR